MSGALAYLVVTLFDQAAREEREAVRQVATDAEALLVWIKARSPRRRP